MEFGVMMGRAIEAWKDAKGSRENFLGKNLACPFTVGFFSLSLAAQWGWGKGDRVTMSFPGSRLPETSMEGQIWFNVNVHWYICIHYTIS